MKVIKIYVTKVAILLLVIVIQGCSSSDDNVVTSLPSGGQNESGATIQMNFNPNYQFVYSTNKVKDRNFYWTTLIEQDVLAKLALESDTELDNIFSDFTQRINSILNTTNPSAIQIAEALKFTDADKIVITNGIKNVLVEYETAFTNINEDHIEPSGAFNQFEGVSNAYRVHQLIVQQMMSGINNIIDTYAAGIDPLYPDIDRVSYDVNSSQYKQWMLSLLNTIQNNSQNTLFYQPFLQFALGVLELNNRDEAGRFVPLDTDENQATIGYIQNINWDNYTYAAIVVLGDSPNSPGDSPNISIGGMERSDRGVALLNQGLAPLIIFTGANLAPFQSQYHEAIEMKNYIIQQHDIDEEKILVEPHARHTTTNMRNVSRLFYRYGIPTNKKAVVSTIESQSDYLTTNQFLTRCVNEMNHEPVKFYDRISTTEVEFTPLLKVLHLNSVDPLDP